MGNILRGVLSLKLTSVQYEVIMKLTSYIIREDVRPSSRHHFSSSFYTEYRRLRFMMCELVEGAKNAWRWFHCSLGLQGWLHSIFFGETDDMCHLVFDTR